MALAEKQAEITRVAAEAAASEPQLAELANIQPDEAMERAADLYTRLGERFNDLLSRATKPKE